MGLNKKQSSESVQGLTLHYSIPKNCPELEKTRETKGVVKIFQAAPAQSLIHTMSYSYCIKTCDIECTIHVGRNFHNSIQKAWKLVSLLIAVPIMRKKGFPGLKRVMM